MSDPMSKLVLETARDRTRLRTAHEAMMLEDAQQVLAINRAGLRLHQGMHQGAAPAEGEGESVIHVGDSQVVHQHAAPAGVPRWVLPLVAGAALVAGAGGAAGLLSLVRPQPPAGQVGDTELRVKWWVEDGEIKTEVEPVK